MKTVLEVMLSTTDQPTFDVVPIDTIRPSSVNPRTNFDESALAELAASIKAVGLLEPIVVRDVAFEGRYGDGNPATLDIICGERRWRAAKLAGLADVPIRNLGAIDDRRALELALIENLQRADLDPLDEARGYEKLNRVVGMKQAQIAAAVHKSQPTIANRMRLLELPTDVQERIRKGELSPSHGVALARFVKFPAIASKLAEYAVKQKWSSGDLESPVPAPYALSGDNLIRSIHPYEIDETICKKACPFQAYRGPESYGSSHCLRPDHYDELKRQRTEEREAEWRAGEEGRRTRLAETNPAAAAALPEIGTIPIVQDFYNSGLVEIPDPPPDGCSTECPCFGQVLRYSRLTNACKDPRRLEKYKRATTIAANKGRRADAKALRVLLKTKLDGLLMWGKAEWLVISTQALGHPIETHRVAPKWRELSGDPNPMATLQSTGIGSLDVIAHNQGTIGLAKLVIGAILGGEIDAYYEGFRGSADLTRWYLDVGDVDPEVEQARAREREIEEKLGPAVVRG